MDFDSFFVKESFILSLYIIGKREPSVSALQQEGPAMPRKGRYVKKSDQPGYVETRGGAGKPSPKRYTIDTPLNDRQERFVKLDAKYGVTFQRHLKDLQVIRDLALQNGAYSAAVQAEKSRGMAHGDIYVSKSEVRHGSIDSMSKDEVLKALQDIKESYALIDITPEDENSSESRGEQGERVVEADEDGDRQE
jgi:hypothetical protein